MRTEHSEEKEAPWKVVTFVLSVMAAVAVASVVMMVRAMMSHILAIMSPVWGLGLCRQVGSGWCVIPTPSDG